MRIAPINSVAAYSAFMLRELGRHFCGEHVLVIQWDSFILRGDLWEPEFLEYDYIGAPWALRPAVGNGGFSLRSRRLVDALCQLDIAVTHPEDVVICVHHGEQLSREHGIRFAPESVAARFAFEDIAPGSPTFGFHGAFNFHHAFDDAELTHYIGLCDAATMQSVPMRYLAKNLYKSGRYRMARRIIRRRLGGTPGQVIDAILLGLRSLWHGLRVGHSIFQ